MSSGESTASAWPVAIAASGMLSNSAVSGSWTNTVPPADRTAWQPRAPSVPAPEKITAMERSPASSREGGEKFVDGKMDEPLGVNGRLKEAVSQADFLARRGEIESSRLGLETVGYFLDHERGTPGGQELGKEALVFRGKVLDEDQGETEVRREHGRGNAGGRQGRRPRRRCRRLKSSYGNYRLSSCCSTPMKFQVTGINSKPETEFTA